MTPPPPGQGPVDPSGAFTPPPPPGGMPPMMQAPPGMGGYPPPPPMGFGPPPGFMPPGFFPPPKPPRGVGRALFTTLITTVFGISLMANIYLLILTGVMGDHASKNNTLVQGDPKQVVAVVPVVNSLITQKDADSLDELLKEVEKNDNVKALVIRIDTPGGEVAPSDEMYHRILQFKAAHTNIPVVISMGGMATSGGYYTAVAGDYLFAEPTTLTGNIGVLMESLNFSRLIDKWGIDDTTMHSSGATYKTSGSMFRPQSEDDKAYLRGILDSIADQFHAAVKTGRAGKLKGSMDDIFNAQAYPAQAALKLGLVDQIGYQEDACKYAATKAGLTNMTVVTFEQQVTLLKLLSGKSNLPDPTASSNLKINGIPVQSDTLDHLLSPRPLYLFKPD
jgi:protease IV